MQLTNAQRPVGHPIDVDPEHIIGLRRRNDGSTVILQDIAPTHLHVQERFDVVLQKILGEWDE